MNEKIKELAKQSGIYLIPNSKPISIGGTVTDLEKFAELIIKDMNRQPLSDCDIHLIIKKAVNSVGITRDGSTSMRISRAIEAAHGIGVGE